MPFLYFINFGEIYKFRPKKHYNINQQDIYI